MADMIGIDTTTIVNGFVLIAIGTVGWYTKLIERRLDKAEAKIADAPVQFVLKGDYDKDLVRLEKKIDDGFREVMIELRLKANKD